MLLSHKKYAQETLERAGMRTCKPATIHVDTNSKLSADSGPPVADPTHYCTLAGALQYLTFTHPDIAYVVEQLRLITYTDVDWGDSGDISRSTSGYCCFLSDNLISRQSKRQPTTLSRSSVEAEYRSVANVVEEACWLCNLLLELHCPLRQATIFYCDNTFSLKVFHDSNSWSSSPISVFALLQLRL
ncbi:uncharacterized mitochondrial protein AtMg00810-like [Beta vulgaris subsp. vulgaris]|uniref:uncharacterized mitochondrial protein AtMg00810-like n=1 Tax=Beta vulgaris subsp. vulgaris TaxID=3555 RepID=UPI002036DAC8|nr:uncharacterized mitochondrial protein AtMg00810-like [Beta vulgaris subsp. vulgaris]